MKNLSNLGLVEMTEQEMREVNGGISWKAMYGLVSTLFGFLELTQDSDPHPHPGKCYCDQLQGGMCDSCLEGLKY
ncbi:MAG: hypothetical protein UH850_07385 [Paludibacteraceae bacterium]|nr:hypothetical protein [Paludibacteraceae bacterium]